MSEEAKTMKKFIVFLDSNIYDAANYSFGNPQFSKLKELIEQNYVVLIYNSVVEGEVKRHIKESIKKAVKEFNDLVSTRDFTSFRYEEEYAEKIKRLNFNDMYELCQKRFDEYLENCHAIKIPVNGINVEDIISDYVAGNYPFEISKPAEFKDAIIIQSLLEYKKLMKDATLSIITKDKGFRAALKSNGEFIYPYINKFLEMITETINTQTLKLKEYLTAENIRDSINDEIKIFIEKVNYSLEIPYDEYDIINIENISFDIAFVDIITSVEAKIIIDVEADINMWFTYIDEDQSFFDREDGQYLWKVEVEKEEVHKINFELSLNIDIENFSDDIDPNNFEAIVEGHEDGPSSIDLNESTFISGEVVSDNYRDYEDNDSHNVCPDCGVRMTFENDGLTGFCTKCSPNH